MKIRTNDTVKVIAGKEIGKTGKVIQVFPNEDRVVVEGINTMAKHVRAPRRGEKGQRVEFSGPIHVSNVMLVCPSCSKPTRVSKKVLESHKRVRVCKKCNQSMATS